MEDKVLVSTNCPFEDASTKHVWEAILLIVTQDNDWYRTFSTKEVGGLFNNEAIIAIENPENFSAILKKLSDDGYIEPQVRISFKDHKTFKATPKLCSLICGQEIIS